MKIANLSTWYARLRAAFPAVAFFGGFLWDAITLGRSIQPLDLFTLLAYLVGAGILLLWMGRREYLPATAETAAQGSESSDASGVPAPAAIPTAAARGFAAEAKAPGLRSMVPRLLHMAKEEGPTMALQFFFGGMFSALVIFYFLSSSYLPGFAVVALLTVLLGLNEFLEGHYRHRFTLTWTLFALCAMLFFNFALPHLFRSVNPVWFYVSTGLGLALVCLIRQFSPKAKGSLLPSAAVAAILIGLFAVNAIPPVPLVKKNVAICRELIKTDGVYTARIEKPPLFAFWRRSESIVHQRPEEKIFCFTSVFIPTGIECTLYHNWCHKDPRTGKWTAWSRIGFPIHGGRQEGYRGYTWKKNLEAGRWQVRVETEEGRVLGVTRFTVASIAEESPLVFRDLTLH